MASLAAFFHQSQPQFTAQFKLFPVRIPDAIVAHLATVNSTSLDGLLGNAEEVGTAGNDFPYGEYDEELKGVSLIAFLPIVVIGVFLCALFLFLRCRRYRSDRNERRRLGQIYDALEGVNRIGMDPRHDIRIMKRFKRALLSDGSSPLTAAPQQQWPMGRRDSFKRHEYQFLHAAATHGTNGIVTTRPIFTFGLRSAESVGQPV